MAPDVSGSCVSGGRRFHCSNCSLSDLSRILLALIAWSFYVVVGRVCTPMIRGNSNTGLGKAVGGEPVRDVSVPKADIRSWDTGRIRHLVAFVRLVISQRKSCLSFDGIYADKEQILLVGPGFAKNVRQAATWLGGC